MLKKKSLKILSIIIGIIAITSAIVFAAVTNSNNYNHYVVDVVKEQASSNDDNLKITEKIVKEGGQLFFDSKELNYEVDLENVKPDDTETQVAMVVDTSYSMKKNDKNGTAIERAKALAEGILDKVENAKVSISTNNSVKLNMTNKTKKQN